MMETTMWNRLRYTLWAPLYDRLLAAVDFDEPRRQSIARLGLGPGDRVLIAGAGTGLDLPHLPNDVRVSAVDVTPAMLARLERRAADRAVAVDARVMDARQLAYDAGSFDAVVLHLVLAVMPEPHRGLAEAARVLKPGGRIAVFDKFLADAARPSVTRRAVNLVVGPLITDINRRFGTILRESGAPLVVEHDEPAAWRGLYRRITLRKTA
jgi:ubiquinone/menaquinone biosynthesis C-methylase UbiE